MSASDGVELVWRAGPYAVIWKGDGVPIHDVLDCGSNATDGCSGGKDGKGGKGSKGGKGGKAGKGAAEGGRGRRGQGQALSVVSWLKQGLDGAWEPMSFLSTATAGLVLLARSGIAPPSAVHGTLAILAAPGSVPAGAELAAAESDAVRELWEPLGLVGGMDEDGARVVEEVPSGHFGRLALAELDTDLGPRGQQARASLSAVLSLQEEGFRAVRLPGGKASSQRHGVEAPAQEEGQDDVVAGTCVAVVALQLPRAALEQQARPGRVKADASGRVRVAAPAKFTKLMASERTLMEQRQRGSEGEVTFRGMSLLVPGEQLRPRPSSGSLVDAALAAVRGLEAPRILDLGVGSGALLLAALGELGGEARGEGVDIDEGAVQTCKANALRVLGERGAARARALLGDFSKLDEPDLRSQLADQGYDVIVCNPPYRSEAQQAAYDRSTGEFGGNTEHSKTLVAGETGLEMYEAVAACIARDAAAVAAAAGASAQEPSRGPLLRRGGVLIFQVEAGSCGRTGGMAQVVGAAVERAGGGELVVRGAHVDEQGLERAILVRRRSAP